MSIVSRELFAQAVNDKTAASWAGFGKKLMSWLPSDPSSKFTEKVVPTIMDWFGGTNIRKGLAEGNPLGKHNIRKGAKWFANTESGAELIKKQREAASAVKDALGKGVDRNSEEFKGLMEQLKGAGKARTEGFENYLKQADGDIIADTFGKRVAGAAAGTALGAAGLGYGIKKATEEPEHWYDRFTKRSSLDRLSPYLQDKLAGSITSSDILPGLSYGFGGGMIGGTTGYMLGGRTGAALGSVLGGSAGTLGGMALGDSPWRRALPVTGGALMGIALANQDTTPMTPDNVRLARTLVGGGLGAMTGFGLSKLVD